MQSSCILHYRRKQSYRTPEVTLSPASGVGAVVGTFSPRACIN